MAQSRTIPVNYPQALAVRMLRAETQRQLSAVRQESVTELLALLAETHEANVRARLLKLAEHNLRLGTSAAERAQDLWPQPEEAKLVIEGDAESKPAASRRNLRVFDQLNGVHERSLGLLQNSFEHARVILDRLKRPETVAPSVPPKAGPA